MTYAPNATTWASLDFIADEHFAKFTHAVSLEDADLGPGIEPYASTTDDPSGDRHGLKLNELARRVCEVADDNDVLLFLDGDALLMGNIDKLLNRPEPLIAVRRDENDGDQFPHPSFCMVSVAHWRRLGGDWRRGEFVTSATGRVMTDTGTRLLTLLNDGHMDWLPLLRLNTRELHPVWFGVYGTPELGPIVYHHGAGFRPRLSRADLAKSGSVSSFANWRSQSRQRRLDRRIQRGLDRDPRHVLRKFTR